MGTFGAEFGARLRAERERLGLTQDEFARIGGVQKLAQHNYEKGERIPSVEYLSAVEAHGVNAGYLLGGGKGAAFSAIVDVALLQGIITGLENSLSRLGFALPSNKKARIIAMLYRIFSADGVITDSVIDEFVHIAIDEVIEVRPRLR